MNLNGDPAPNPPPDMHEMPDNDRRPRVTLGSCRAGLRTAVRLLNLYRQSTPPTPDPTDGSPSGGDIREDADAVAILQEIQHAEQAYDELLTNISHDVKTSLTVICGHAQMTARAIRRGDEIDPEALLATLKVIETSALQGSKELDGWMDEDRAGAG